MALRCRSSEISQILDAVLDSAIDRSRWPVALEHIAKATDSVGALYMACSFKQPENGLLLLSSGLDEDLGQLALERHQSNVHARAMVSVPLGCAVDSSTLVSPKVLRRTEFHADVLVPQQIRTQVAVRLPIIEQADSGGVAIEFNNTNVRKVRHGVELLNAIAPALQHASAATTRMPASDLPVTTVLETLPTAVIIVDAKANVAFMNARAQAIILASDGFDVSGRQLVVHDRTTQVELMRLISAATTQDLRQALPSIACRVRRKDSKPPLIVHVSAMRDVRGLLTLPGRTHAILFISRPEDDKQHSSACLMRLRVLFSLTQAEARVALSVATGKNIPEVANELRVGDGTVHTHLHRVFEKTGVRRQSGLARMLTRTGILDLP